VTLLFDLLVAGHQSRVTSRLRALSSHAGVNVALRVNYFDWMHCRVY